jgi:hypothetical protein
MGANTSAGTTILIGTTQSDPTTDTYVEIAEITTIPEFGRVYKEITFNPLKTRGTEKFKGSYDDGSTTIEGAKSSGDAGQQAVLAALNTDFDYNFKIIANDAVPAAVSTVGISIATPGLVSSTAHGLPALTGVKFAAGAGTLPTGITAGTTYYICAGATLLTNTFAVATSLTNAAAGTGIATTGSAGVGNTMTTVPAPTNQLMKAKVMSAPTNYSGVDNITMTKFMLSIKSGSIVETPHLP